MATLQDLLDDVAANYDIVELIEKGTTAGGKIFEYDLWYRSKGIVAYKRLHIYVKDDVAEWYNSNPIPIVAPILEITFQQRIETEILVPLYDSNSNIKYLAINTIDSTRKKAEIIGKVLVNNIIKTKYVFVHEDNEGVLQISDIYE